MKRYLQSNLLVFYYISELNRIIKRISEELIRDVTIGICQILSISIPSDNCTHINVAGFFLFCFLIILLINSSSCKRVHFITTSPWCFHEVRGTALGPWVETSRSSPRNTPSTPNPILESDNLGTVKFPLQRQK